jgi:hypothetical protein
MTGKILDDSSCINEHALLDWDVVDLKRTVKLSPKIAEKKRNGLSSSEVLNFGGMMEEDFKTSLDPEHRAVSFDFNSLLSLLCCVRDDAADFGDPSASSTSGMRNE